MKRYPVVYYSFLGLMVVCLLLWLSQAAHSQMAITSNYSYNYFGDYIGVGCQKHYGKMDFSGGIKFHLPIHHRLPADFGFKKKALPLNFWHSLGIQAGVFREIVGGDHKPISIGVFGQFDYMRTEFNDTGLYPVGFYLDTISGISGILYAKIPSISPPISTLEYNMGLKFTVDLSKRMALYQQFGGGIGIIFERTFSRIPIQWQLIGPFYQVGISYRLKE